MNETVPVGVPEPESGATIAVYVVAVPKVAVGLTDGVIVVATSPLNAVVDAAITSPSGNG